MKLSALVLRLSLFLLCFVSALAATGYSEAVYSWSLPLPSKTHKQAALREFEQEAASILGEKTAKGLVEDIHADLPKGTCYGQSYAFMLLNPPQAKEIQFPHSRADYKKIIWLQAYSNTCVYAYQQYLSIEQKTLKLIRKAFPDLGWSEKKITKHVVKLLTKLEKKKRFKRDCLALARDYLKFKPWVDLAIQMNEKVETLLLPFKARDEISGKIEPGTSASLNELFLKEFIHVAKDPSISDAIIIFDLEWEGEMIGHAILVQLDHLRIYDAMAGIFQYGSMADLAADIPVGEHEGSTFFTITPYSIPPD